ncbi:MAG TPA: EamA family transporter, partial [Candidatus Saccharimonadia bacterium]
TFNHWYIIFWSQLLRLGVLAAVFLIFSWELRISWLSLTLAVLSSGIFLLGLRFTFHALKVGPVSLASPFIGSYAFPAVLLSLVFLGEQLQYSQLVAVVLLIFGAILISVSSRTHLPQRNFWTQPVVRLALIGAICIGTAVFFLAQLVHLAGWQTAIMLQTIVLIVGSGIGLWLTGVALLPANRKPLNGAIIGLSAFGLMGALMLSYGFSVSLVAIVAPVASTSPLITVGLSLYFFKERLSRYQLVGILVVVLALSLLAVR